jgi:predicted kinase
MLIVMGGLPKSGKTIIANHIANKFGATLFGVDHLLPENIDQFPEDEQKEIRLYAWKQCHSSTIKFCSNKKKSREIAIYDTAGSSVMILEEIKRLCSIYDHGMVYVYVHDTMERCHKRGVDKKLLNDYFEKFMVVLKRFRDCVEIIKNSGTPDHFVSSGEELCQRLSSKIQMISQ